MTDNRTPEFLAQFRPYYGFAFAKRRPDYDRCAAEILGAGRADWPHQCANNNGHGLHGAWCKRHDPEAVKAKQKANYDKWRIENAAKERTTTFAIECQTAIRQIAAGHNDPRGLAQSIIDKLDGKP